MSNNFPTTVRTDREKGVRVRVGEVFVDFLRVQRRHSTQETANGPGQDPLRTSKVKTRTCILNLIVPSHVS